MVIVISNDQINRDDFFSNRAAPLQSRLQILSYPSPMVDWGVVSFFFAKLSQGKVGIAGPFPGRGVVEPP